MKEEKEEILKKTRSTYFQKQSGNIRANEIPAIGNIEVKNVHIFLIFTPNFFQLCFHCLDVLVYLAMNTDDDSVNNPSPCSSTSTTNFEKKILLILAYNKSRLLKHLNDLNLKDEQLPILVL